MSEASHKDLYNAALEATEESAPTPAVTPPAEAVPSDAAPVEQPEPTRLQPTTMSEARALVDAAERGDGQEPVPLPEAVQPPAEEREIPVSEVEVAVAEPLSPSEVEESTPGTIRTGPGMSEEAARAIREQQLIEREIRSAVFAGHVAAVQEFAGQFEDSVYRTGEAFRGERAMASTELPQVAVAALHQAEAAYLRVVKASNGRVPENVGNALAQTRTELAHQAAARQARERLIILQRETKGTTAFGTDKPFQKEMRSVFDSLRRLGNYDQIQGEIEKLQGLRDHELAKSPEQVNRKIAEHQERLHAHESVDGLLAWKGLDPNLRRAIAAVRAGRRLDFGDTSKHPVDALRQRFYKEVVTLLVPADVQSRGEAVVPAAIPTLGSSDGRTSHVAVGARSGRGASRDGRSGESIAPDRETQE